MPRTITSFVDEYAFLSNFYMYSGTTVETEFQAAKAVNDQDKRWVLESPTPGEAKRRGRQIQLRGDWEQEKNNVMLDLLRDKFTDPELRAKLIATGDALIVEGNTWHDNYWGDCECPNCAGRPGRNQLGRLLTQVREEIQQ